MRACVHQIAHSLGLEKIHLAIQDRALGELSRLGRPSAEEYHLLEHRRRHCHSSMACQLDHGLAGVGVWRVESGDKRTIENTSVALIP